MSYLHTYLVRDVVKMICRCKVDTDVDVIPTYLLS